jgi:hypothetical protein
MTNTGKPKGGLIPPESDEPSVAQVGTFIDPALYYSAVGDHDMISFTEAVVSAGDFLSSQYAPVGVEFADGTDQVLSNTAFVTDNVGVNANGDVTLVFSAAQTHLGLDFPGDLRIELYDGSVNLADLVWSSEAVGDFGGSGTGYFAGLVSDVSFDHVILSDPHDGYAFIDNLHYVVPEPGTLGLLAVGAVAAIRRRRDC